MIGNPPTGMGELPAILISEEMSKKLSIRNSGGCSDTRVIVISALDVCDESSVIANGMPAIEPM